MKKLLILLLFSIFYTANVFAIAPEAVLLSVSTGTITFMIDTHGISPKTTYSFLLTLPDQTPKYIQKDGSFYTGVGPGVSVYESTATWGGYMLNGTIKTGTGFVVKISTFSGRPTSFNGSYQVKLNAAGSPYVSGSPYYGYGFSTYTLASAPTIQFALSGVQVSTSAINLNLFTSGNSVSTKYAIKAVLADGTTRYLQSNHTMGSTLTAQTTTQWSNNNIINLRSLISNMGYRVQAAAQNGDDVLTDYSNSASTWTSLAKPSAPTVLPSWDIIGGDSYNNVSVTLSPSEPNSIFTKYVIICNVGTNIVNYYFDGKGDASHLRGDCTYYYSQTWKTNGTTDFRNYFRTFHSQYTKLPSNSLYKFKIMASSGTNIPDPNNTNYISDPPVDATTPPSQPNIPDVKVIDNDYIRIAWLKNNAFGAIGASKMNIYYSPIYYNPSSWLGSGMSGLTYITQAEHSQLDDTYNFYNYHINASTPLAANDSWTEPDINSIVVNWQKVANPAASKNYYFSVAGVNTEGSVGQPSDLPIISTSVQPIINSYKVYTGTYSRNITDLNDLKTTFTRLLPNTTFTYKISAVSSQKIGTLFDNYLEGPKVTFSTCTLAALATGATAYTSWSPNSQFHNVISYGVNNNPPGTEFAVRFMIPDGSVSWVDSSGSGLGSTTPVWIATTTWLHKYLLADTTYQYNIYSRNRVKVVTPAAATFKIKTRFIKIPIINMWCQYSTLDARVVKNSGLCTSRAPLFNWGLVFSSFSVTGYSVTWSTNTFLTPTYIVNNTNTYFSPIIVSTCSRDYYFKVKAHDNQNQWSEVIEFLYRFTTDYKPVSIPQENFGGKTFNGMIYGVPLNMNIKLNFGNIMSTDTLTAANIHVEAIANEVEVSTSGKVYPNISYALPLTSATVITLTANPKLNSNWTYAVVMSTNVQDNAMNNPSSRFTSMLFRTIISTDTQSSIRISDLKVSGQKPYMVLSSSSVPANVYIVMNDNPIIAPQQVSTSTLKGAQTKIINNNKLLGYVEMNMYNSSNRLIVSSHTLSRPVSLTMPYDDNNSDGLIDGTSIEVDSLSIWWLDETKQLWSKVSSTINKQTKTISGSIRHLSVYALVGAENLTTDDVMVAPVPWIPEDGNPKTGTLAGGITFRNLPYEGEIKIFTVSGELVRNIDLRSFSDPTGAGYSWDGMNEDGTSVASGVYLWVVQSPQSKKTGKLIVIR